MADLLITNKTYRVITTVSKCHVTLSCFITLSLHNVTCVDTVPSAESVTFYLSGPSVNKMLTWEEKEVKLLKISDVINIFQVKFTDIIKFETFDRDQEYIFLKSGIKDFIKSTKKKNPNKEVLRSSSNFTQHYIDQLSPDLFEKLIDLYLIDFKIFDYPIPVQS